MLIDNHAHLDMSQFDSDREDVILRAISQGVEYIITVGTDIRSSERAIELAGRYDNIYAAIGIHPHEVKDIDHNTYDRLRDMLKRHSSRPVCTGGDEDLNISIHPSTEGGRKDLRRDKKIVAYGEIGLDFYHSHSHRDIQIEMFRRQIQLALEWHLPLIIHSRKAEKETIDILQEECRDKRGLSGVLHCFSGDLKIAKRAIDMGFYISFSGIVTFGNGTVIQDVVKKIPIEHILIETDSPYLTPYPFRGKRNEPAYIEYISRKISELKGLSFEDVSRITSFNTKTLFGFGEIEDEGKVVYQIRDSLYINVTNRCTNTCKFCVRYYTSFVKGHNLKLNREPEREEIIRGIGDPGRYKEIVFCGYGEPLIRLDLVKEIARWVKERGGRVRIDTNGHANLIHKRDILPELYGLVDEISVSLNAEDEERYYKICRPVYGKMTYKKIKEFIIEAKTYIPEVGVTAINLPSIDVTRCKKIANSELKVKFRLREYNVVG